MKCALPTQELLSATASGITVVRARRRLAGALRRVLRGRLDLVRQPPPARSGRWSVSQSRASPPGTRVQLREADARRALTQRTADAAPTGSWEQSRNGAAEPPHSDRK